ncbi:MAG: VOC family protein [Candidatus Nomurabacteria bacterium]|nr:MAG: VOC family protein [Candidatus Nomurabacteria bacterium]
MPRVIHFEIHASDPERAAQFYARVFDWDIQKWDGPEEYWLVNTGADTQAGINGAIFRRQGELSQHDAVIAFVCTIDVPNVDAYIEKVKQHGGHVELQKMAVPGVGWMAYCKDTEGNIFGMMQADPEAV